jgi:hypothetical protein
VAWSCALLCPNAKFLGSILPENCASEKGNECCEHGFAGTGWVCKQCPDACLFA